MDQLAHDRTHNDLAVFSFFFQASIEIDHHRIVSHGHQGRHEKSLSQSSMADFADPGLTLYGTPGKGLFGSETYKSNRFLNTFDSFKDMKSREDDRNGCFTNTGDGVKQISFSPKIRVMVNDLGNLPFQFFDFLIQITNVLLDRGLNGFMSCA